MPTRRWLAATLVRIAPGSGPRGVNIVLLDPNQTNPVVNLTLRNLSMVLSWAGKFEEACSLAEEATRSIVRRIAIVASGVLPASRA